MKVNKVRIANLEKNTPALLQVVWLDAMVSDADPYVPEKNLGGCLLSSLGHLVQEDDFFIYLSRDSGEFGDGRHGCEIPKVNIVEVYALSPDHRMKLMVAARKKTLQKS